MGDILWTQAVHVKDGEKKCGTLVGPDIQLPIPPFKGLGVGALVVRRVSVHQGDQSMTSGELLYKAVDKDHADILVTQGWSRE